jgi:predicted RNA-binding Zn ribbon-like protein
VIERWSWLGEPLAIDFANTVRRRGLEYVEFLDSPRELAVWAHHEGLRLSARDVGPRLPEVRELRDAVFALLLAAAGDESVATGREAAAGDESAGAPPRATTRSEAAAGDQSAGATTPSGAEARLNAALAAVPLVPQLRGGDVELAAPRDAPALDELLARVGASALDVLRDPALSFCDAPSCGQFFLRHRGDQRWCGPACGTRARVARHAAHRR